MLILDLWGISFHAVVVFGLGKNLLFKSILGRCVLRDCRFEITITYFKRLLPGLYWQQHWQGFYFTFITFVSLVVFLKTLNVTWIWFSWPGLWKIFNTFLFTRERPTKFKIHVAFVHAWLIKCSIWYFDRFSSFSNSCHLAITYLSILE